MTSIIDASRPVRCSVTCGRASANASAAIAASANAAGQVPLPGGAAVDGELARRDRREAERVAPGAPAGARSRRDRQRDQQRAPSSHSGEAKLIAGGARARAASRRRSTAPRDATRRRRSSRATASRRSRSSSANRSRTRRREVSTSIRAPVSGSTSTDGRPRAARPRADRRSRPRAPSGGPAATPSGRSQPRWSRKSEITTTSPGWRASRPTRRRAPASASGSSLAVGRDALGEQPAQRDHPGLASRAAAAPAARRRRTRPARRCPPGGRRADRTRARRPRRHPPSADSAVPNAIDGETSSTIHVVSARSGTCRRTCGWPVRAVAAGSMWRTSSPISYGRSWASSVPSADAGRAAVARQRPRDQAADRDVERLDQRLRRSGPGPAGPRAARARARAHPALATVGASCDQVPGARLGHGREHLLERPRRR